MNSSIGRAPRWQQVMWLAVGASLLLTISVLLWFSATTVGKLVEVVGRPTYDHGFVIVGMGLIAQSLIRLLAILVGAAVAFAGLAVSFFAHEQEMRAQLSIGGSSTVPAKVALGAYAPGVVGLVVGAVIIALALFARGEHEYQPGSYEIQIPASEAQQSGSGLPTLEPSKGK
jgi:hypothetical protein